MSVNGLDPTSRRILQLLAADGRASYQAIADEIGLSRPAVMERVKRLEEAGFIRGYHARLERGKCGYPITAFVAIRYPVSEHAGDEPQIAAPVIAMPTIEAIATLTGLGCRLSFARAPIDINR